MALRGTNQSWLPLRRQIEQLHSITESSWPSTSNWVLPQWQLPVYFMVFLQARILKAQSVIGLFLAAAIV
jgi:hypothetical protein